MRKLLKVDWVGTLLGTHSICGRQKRFMNYATTLSHI